MTNGVRLVVQDKNDDTVADWTIPGGAYSTVTKAGWKVHTFPTGMTAQYKNAGTVVPLINGIKKAQVRDEDRPRASRSSAPSARTGVYPIAMGDEPVKVTFIADPPIGETGSVLRDALPGSGADGAELQLHRSGSTLRCK
jgi:hypothetical protein